MFYTFNQNNSGGSFDYNEQRGISCKVIVEADSSEQAIEIAKSVGVYFGGVKKGYDCGCCGDRWYEPYADEGDPVPSIYGESLVKVEKDGYKGIKWIRNGYQVFTHFKNGAIVGSIPGEEMTNDD